jgi:hypothetical protein
VLGFIHSVRKSFAFLPTLGFQEVSASEEKVVFRKDRWGVGVHHEMPGFELGASLYFNDTRYSLGEVLRVADPSMNKYRDVSARSADFVAMGVSNLAELVQQHVLPLICGDPEFLEKLERGRRELGETVNVQFARQRAVAAFQNRDFATAAKWYGMVENKLTAVERKRLLIARQHLV